MSFSERSPRARTARCTRTTWACSVALRRTSAEARRGRRPRAGRARPGGHARAVPARHRGARATQSSWPPTPTRRARPACARTSPVSRLVRSPRTGRSAGASFTTAFESARSGSAALGAAARRRPGGRDRTGPRVRNRSTSHDANCASSCCRSSRAARCWMSVAALACSRSPRRSSALHRSMPSTTIRLRSRPRSRMPLSTVLTSTPAWRTRMPVLCRSGHNGGQSHTGGRPWPCAARPLLPARDVGVSRHRFAGAGRQSVRAPSDTLDGWAADVWERAEE